MSCLDCRSCANNNIAVNTDKVCCEPMSPRYNKVVTAEMASRLSCPLEETQQAYDWRNMSPWDFANKYYN